MVAEFFLNMMVIIINLLIKIILDKSIKLFIYRSLFTKNEAISGGGIFWLKRIPFFQLVNFNENLADYGHNIASYPIRILFEVFEKHENEILQIYSSKNNQSEAFLKNLSPGNPLPLILRFSLVDIDGEIVKTANGFLHQFFSSYLIIF